MILAADLGTGSLKAALISRDGTMRARVRIPYKHPPGLGRDDFDPLQWEDAFGEALRALPAVRIAAIALSGNGPTLVPCRADGEPVAPADLWLQERSVRRADRDSYYLPKAAWLKTHDRGTWRQTRWLLSCPEWLQFRLTGKATMTLPHESFRRFVWDADQLEDWGFNPRLFPEMVTMGDCAGTVNAAAAARWGLPARLPVAAVGSDFMAALLGSGAVEPGMVCDRAGTSEGINYCCRMPSGDNRLRDLPHVVEGLWNSAAILSSTGAVFEWYRRLTGQSRRSYEETLADVDAVEAGREAPLFFPGARGEVLWEFAGGSFHRLEPGHGPAEMGRAVMEAIGFAVRRGIELLGQAGLPVSEMRVCGGQARGKVWNQVKADITGCRLLIPAIEDAELAGCAACADVVLGSAKRPLDAMGRYVRIRDVIEPRPRIKCRYDEVYLRYREAALGLLDGSA